jgi:hypothetical protein
LHGDLIGQLLTYKHINRISSKDFQKEICSRVRRSLIEELHNCKNLDEIFDHLRLSQPNDSIQLAVHHQHSAKGRDENSGLIW